jgi:CotH protein/lamin tail-like protein/dockerin type I repeat protein
MEDPAPRRWPVPLGSLLAAALLFCGGPASPAAAADCARPDDFLQVLDFFLEMDPADWDVVRFDTTFTIERPALFHCGDEAPVPASVRRKLSPALPSDSDPIKVSLKIDFDDVDPDGAWRGYHKIGLENGISGSSNSCALVREGLSWILMARSGVISGNVSWVRLQVNGSPAGVYTRIEQVDKSFLRRHVGEDDGFLYKFDSHAANGPVIRQTRIDEPDPYQDELCFPPFAEACSLPPESPERMRRRLAIHQLVTLGVVNTILGNTDGLLEGDNNYFWYNSLRPRLYFPWDLDLTLYFNLGRFPHSSEVERELYVADPRLRRYFDAILLRLLGDLLAPASVDALIDQVAAGVGPAIDADPLNGLQKSFAAEIESVRQWLLARADFLRKHTMPLEPDPVVLNEVQAWNVGGPRDEGGEAADWVEICNRGSSEASLDGLYLSDDLVDPTRWPLPGGTLPPGGRLLIWCDGDVEEGPLHASFKLDRDGDAVGLFQEKDGLVRAVDFIRFGRQQPDMSWGRFPDGAPAPRSLPCPTPGAENRADCPPGERFTRGDVTGDGAVDRDDLVALLRGIFLAGPISCWDAADVDDDGRATVIDAVQLIGHLYRGGERPRPPFPGCGFDLTGDDLDCAGAGVCGGTLSRVSSPSAR